MNIKHSMRFGLLTTLSLLVCAAVQASTHTEGSFSEDEVKAALLYNATKFIRWPEARDLQHDRSMRLCVIGKDPNMQAIGALNGQKIHAAPIRVLRREFDSPELANCDIAYFSEVAPDRNRYALESLADTPVLTVGQSRAFAEHGGVMALVVKSNRVNFVINATAARERRLEINAQLLEVAEVVDGTSRAQKP
jgi:hypothetical protein